MSQTRTLDAHAPFSTVMKAVLLSQSVNDARKAISHHRESIMLACRPVQTQDGHIVIPLLHEINRLQQAGNLLFALLLLAAHAEFVTVAGATSTDAISYFWQFSIDILINAANPTRDTMDLRHMGKELAILGRAIVEIAKLPYSSSPTQPSSSSSSAAADAAAVAASFDAAALVEGISSGEFVKAISVLRDAATAVAADRPLLTPLHASALELCIHMDMEHVACELATTTWVDIMEIDVPATGLSADDYMKYFYYAGTACATCEHIPKALGFFSECYLAPSESVSALAIRAYKRAVLLTLISTGNALKVPTYVSPCFKQYLQRKGDVEGYQFVVDPFIKSDLVALNNALESNMHTFEIDGTLGMALELNKSLVRHRVSRLTTTYITLTLDAIAAAAGLASGTMAEKLIVSMVAAGTIKASIDQRSGMVAFGSGTGAGTGTGVENVAALEARLQTTMQITEKVRMLHGEIISSKEYVSAKLQ